MGWRQRGHWGVLLLLALAGCGPTLEQERLREIADDGVVLYQEGRYREARATFEYALGAVPGDANLLYNLGRCHDRLGELAKAETCFQQCVERQPHHAASRQALAVVYLKTGRRAQADELIEGWLAAEPEKADAYALDGWRLRQDGQVDEAKGRLQQALLRDPHNARALVELGRLFEQQEYPERALVLYERALQVTPHDEEVIDRVNELKRKGVGLPRPG